MYGYAILYGMMGQTTVDELLARSFDSLQRRLAWIQMIFLKNCMQFDGTKLCCLRFFIMLFEILKLASEKLIDGCQPLNVVPLFRIASVIFEEFLSFGIGRRCQ